MDYVLITPANNEEEFIGETIKSVVAQTKLPRKWVIVSDGSTDNTNAIVEKYLPSNKWIDLVYLPQRNSRDFAAKVHAFNAGFDRIKGIEYEIIGNLDADVTFEKEYFEYLTKQFEKDDSLGVAGTHYVENGFHSYKDSYINVNHVNGQCQLFKKECFDDIGGYQPIETGGIDWVAVTTARMKGWRTYSFGDKVFYHHRKMGTANRSVLRSRYHYGKKDYFLGNHPLWEILRISYQMVRKPYLIGGSALGYGYFKLWFTHAKRPISKELMQFHRNEQKKRMKGLILDKANVVRN